MADIALSKGVRQNLLSMQSTVDLMGRTQNRLATGKKVNSALDNPTSFFVSAGLENRANDLGRLLDSMGLGIKTLEAADNGIKGIKRLIETAQGTARQALQAASSTPKAVSQMTTLTGATALTGAAPGLGFQAANEITVTLNGVSSAPFIVGTTGTTLQALVDHINGDDTLQGSAITSAKVHAKIENGRLIIESLTGQALEVLVEDAGGATPGTAAAAATRLLGNGVLDTATPPVDVTYSLPAQPNPSRSSLAKQFEELKSQIDQLIKDAGFNGTNLLNGDVLKVLFNETNTTSLTIEGVVLNSLGLGLSPINNGESADSTNGWQSDREIDAALKKLDAALNMVRTQASNFGSNLIVMQTRQDFTKQAITTLNGGSDLLVLADTNEEGANLLALQTRQQLSTQALSLASQTDQAVLRLFG